MSNFDGRWILSPRWDLGFLILSAALVPFPWLLSHGLHLPATLVSLAVTAFLGGPHLFATFTYTLMERRFWRKHPVFAGGSLLIPPMVVYLGLAHFEGLILLFYVWASIHVLHQASYLADCYQTQAKGSSRTSKWLRAIDYSVIFSSLYPLIASRLVHGSLQISEIKLNIPFVFDNPPVFFLMCSLFIVSVLLYVAKSIWEWKTGQLSGPKTILIAVTVVVCLVVALPQDLDLAFQGLNAWHSLQYIAIVWWINNLRKQKGRIGSPFVQSISGPSKVKALLFYVSGLVPTLAFLGLIAGLTKATDQPAQSYYIIVLSGVFMHYYFAHWTFTRIRLVVPRKSRIHATNKSLV